ncbi:MAG: hypothetical protein ACTTJC_00710 [Campylobacter sp.]
MNKFNENLFKKDKATIYHYRAGLFGSGYFGDKDGEFFQIFPVTALKNDDKTTEKQSFLITDKNSSEKIKINLNTYYDKYGGDKILLRGFAEKNSQHIICYDAVYSAKTPGVIQMVLYYQKGKKLFKKDIKFKKAGVKNASID